MVGKELGPGASTPGFRHPQLLVTWPPLRPSHASTLSQAGSPSSRRAQSYLRGHLIRSGSPRRITLSQSQLCQVTGPSHRSDYPIRFTVSADSWREVHKVIGHWRPSRILLPLVYMGVKSRREGGGQGIEEKIQHLLAWRKLLQGLYWKD